MLDTTLDKITIFCSWSFKSEEDAKLKIELQKYLSDYRWFASDTLQGGDSVVEKMIDQLDEAQIILLLISVDYIASPSCEREMRRAMAHHNAGNARVIPIYLRPITDSYWARLPFGDLNRLPKNGVPISKWIHPDEAYMQIANDIDDIRKKLQQKQYIEKAVVSAQELNYDASAAFYEKAAKSGGGVESPYNLYRKIGDVRYQQKDFEKALYAYNDAKSFNSEDSTLYLKIGKTLSHLYRHKEALETYEWGLRLDSNNIPLNEAKGDILLEIGDFSGAYKAYEKALRGPHKTALLYRKMGDTQFNLGYYQDAINSYNEALHLDPENIDLFLQKGRALSAAGHLQEALDVYRRAIEIQPEDFRGWRYQGRILFQEKEFRGAVHCYQQAIKRNPDGAYLHKELGDVFFGEEQLLEAYWAYKRAIEINERYAEAYSSKGDVLIKLAEQSYAYYEQLAQDAYYKAQEIKTSQNRS